MAITLRVGVIVRNDHETTLAHTFALIRIDKLSNKHTRARTNYHIISGTNGWFREICGPDKLDDAFD